MKGSMANHGSVQIVRETPKFVVVYARHSGNLDKAPNQCSYLEILHLFAFGAILSMQRWCMRYLHHGVSLELSMQTMLWSEISIVIVTCGRRFSHIKSCFVWIPYAKMTRVQNFVVDDPKATLELEVQVVDKFMINTYSSCQIQRSWFQHHPLIYMDNQTFIRVFKTLHS